MAGRKSDFTLTKLDDLFSTQEQRDEEKLSKIRDIPLTEIDDFPDHPFKVRDDEDMCGFAERNDLFELCSECMVSDDYIEIAHLFGSRVANASQLYPLSCRSSYRSHSGSVIPPPDPASGSACRRP